MDRNDLIRALGNAFTEPQKQEESKSTVISASAGEKDVLRLLTNYDEPNSEKNLHQNHPDAHLVNSLIHELSLSGQGNIELAGRELFLKFNDAVANNDEEKITDIVATCKECYFKLQSLHRSSPERALLYMTTLDAIKKM